VPLVRGEARLRAGNAQPQVRALRRRERDRRAGGHGGRRARLRGRARRARGKGGDLRGGARPLRGLRRRADAAAGQLRGPLRVLRRADRGEGVREAPGEAAGDPAVPGRPRAGAGKLPRVDAPALARARRSQALRTQRFRPCRDVPPVLDLRLPHVVGLSGRARRRLLHDRDLHDAQRAGRVGHADAPGAAHALDAGRGPRGGLPRRRARDGIGGRSRRYSGRARAVGT
jgi:hypothetical protein